MSDPDLSPQEEEVRRLLASARHDEPMPDDVAARLDRVLTDLRAEGTPRPPADLAAARARRRRLTTTLVAAAALVVAGVGVSRLDLTSDSMDAGSSDSAGSSVSDSQREDGPTPEDPGAAELSLPTATVTLSADGFDREVRQLLKRAGKASTEDRALAGGVPACPAPSGGGTALPAEYDGAPAVLVVRRPAGGVRVVDLYVCGETTPARSVRLPVG